MAQNDYALDEFYSYVHNSSKYRTKLERSIDSQLWEYAAVLVWKSTILFIYEKLFQKKLLGDPLPDDFNRQLTRDNVTVHNCFDFCCITDDSIYTNLYRMWSNVGANYRQVFKGLLDDRNSLSHVNRYEEYFSEQWFKTYFEKALTLIKYFQSLNNIQLSQRIYDSIDNGSSIQYLSEQDINYLFSKNEFDDSKIMNHLLDFVNILNYSDTLKVRLKTDAINCYLDSSSFANAMTNGKRLLKLANYFTETDVREILRGIYDRQVNPNQIVGSGEMKTVILDLLDKTANIESLKNDWRIFVNKLIEYDRDKYQEVKDKFIEIYGEEKVEEITPVTEN